jgi:hypothetical protein
VKVVIPHSAPEIDRIRRPECRYEVSAGGLDVLLCLKEKKQIENIEVALKATGLYPLFLIFGTAEIKAALAESENSQTLLGTGAHGIVIMEIVHEKKQPAEAAA